MVAPTKNFSNILDSQVDVDSPLDQTLMTQIRDNLVNLKEWLGIGYVAAQNHNHDGVNSAAVVNSQYATHAGYADGSIAWAGIGAVAWLYNNTAAAHGQGGAYAGSGLLYIAENGSAGPTTTAFNLPSVPFLRRATTTWPSATTLPGTWMCMGWAGARWTQQLSQVNYYYNHATIYVRIA